MQNGRKTKNRVCDIKKVAAAWKIIFNGDKYKVVGKKANIQHMYPAPAIIFKVRHCSKEKLAPVQ